MIVPIAAPATIGYLGQKKSAALILGADDHSNIMNGLSDILKGVNDTDVFILGLGDAGRHSETLPDILDNIVVHPCRSYGSSFSMIQTWNANLSYLCPTIQKL